MDGFRQVEKKQADEAIDRADKALSVELAQISATTRDYSGWDDTYEFILDQNQDYIDTNLVDATLISLRMNIMIFVNLSNGIVFKKAVDLQLENETDFPQGLVDLIVPGNLLLSHLTVDSNFTGVVLIPEGAILLSSYPILDSYRNGPIRGSLIFGRSLDTAEVERLSDVTSMELSVFKVNDQDLPSDLKVANSSLSIEHNTFVQPINEEKIAGYKLYNDIYGHKSFILRTQGPRDIYKQGLATITYFMASLIIICLVVGILIMGLMEVLVISRLKRLSVSVGKLGAEGSGPIDLDGEDEFALFAKSLSGKLESFKIIPVSETSYKKGATCPLNGSPTVPELLDGKVYFVDEPKANLVFKVFNSALMKNHQGLCVTRLAPKQVRKAAGLEKTPIVWLSTTTTQDEKTIEPSSIARIHSTILEFMNAAKRPIVLIEGLEYLIFVNNFRYVLTMLNSLYERSVSSEGIILLVLSKQSMVPADWSLLTKNMEEIGHTQSQC